MFELPPPQKVQSPILISSPSCNTIRNVKRLKYHDHWKKDGQAYIEDTGSSAKITFEGRRKRPFISGGLLKHNERYIFEQMHLHWGEQDNLGAEHVIDGITYSMEAHLVHFNEKYSNFSNAVKMKDGIVVIAFFIQASGNVDNTFFAKITDQIQNIQELHSKSPIDSGFYIVLFFFLVSLLLILDFVFVLSIFLLIFFRSHLINQRNQGATLDVIAPKKSNCRRKK